MFQGKLIEQARIVQAFVPINTTGAGQTGAWISFANFTRALCLVNLGAWAGGNAAVTLLQATSSAGAGSKALAFTTYWSWTTTTDVPTKNTASSNTFNAGTANTTYAIEVNNYDLDVANGFKFFSLNTASPGANTDLIQGTVIMYRPGYSGLATDLPSVLS